MGRGRPKKIGNGSKITKKSLPNPSRQKVLPKRACNAQNRKKIDLCREIDDEEVDLACPSEYHQFLSPDKGQSVEEDEAPQVVVLDDVREDFGSLEVSGLDDGNVKEKRDSSPEPFPDDEDSSNNIIPPSQAAEEKPISVLKEDGPIDLSNRKPIPLPFKKRSPILEKPLVQRKMEPVPQLSPLAGPVMQCEEVSYNCFSF